jgi:hypothetical protein
MTNHPTNHDAPAPDLSDQELHSLLGEAYDVPPVPRSLQKRINRGVQAEWGYSPGLADSKVSRLQQSVFRKTRWLKALPVAATLAAVIVLAVVFNAGSPGYAWADMLDAIVRHGVIQVDGSEGMRWLSLSESVVSERTPESSRLLDIRQNFALDCSHTDTQIVRSQLAPVFQTADRDRLLVAFLLADASLEDSSRRLDGLRITNQSWQRTQNSGREEIALRVHFETSAAENIELQMALDPQSQLPRACNVLSDLSGSQTLSLSYPDQSVAQLRELQFPADMAIVDVDDQSPVLIAATDENNNQPDPDTEVKVAQLPATEIIADAAADVQDATASGLPLVGAASKWKAVQVTDRSHSQVLQLVDATLTDLWKTNNVQPAADADEEELLRRVYLDLAGRTPSVNEVRAYLQDQSPNRYEQLVDRLLNSPDHSSHLATVWRTFLIPEGVDLAAFGGIEAFDQWLTQRFASNDSYDEVVRSMLLAEGRLSRSGPLLFYSAVRLDPDQIASRTARVFLGMRLECAQCHDHPFEPWSQQDFWSYAAFFAQISRPQGELESVSTVMRVRDVNRGDVMLPDSETVVPPRFLDGSTVDAQDQTQVRRQQLANWLTSGNNPYFARATANRVWGQMFGKGIVDPIDDFGTQHTPKSPELLELLAGHFINNGFDLRELFRTVALSKAYRLSSGADTVDASRTEWFAQMNVKTLTAEQVYDCITVATMLDAPAGDNAYDFNVARFGNSQRELFLQQFKTPAGQSTQYLGGIPQALTLMNGSLIDGATGLSSSGLLKSLEAPFFTNQQRIEVLYFATLSRRPKPSEWQLLNSYIPQDASGQQLQESLADILWALLNSAEFTMNH